MKNKKRKSNSIISYRTQNSSVVPCIIVSDDLPIKLMAFVWDDLAPFEIFLEISEIGKEERRGKKCVSQFLMKFLSTYELILRLFIGSAFRMSFLFRILIYNDAGYHGDGCH